MIDIISENKVTAIILRKKNEKIEMLVFNFANSDYKYSRLPGGGVENSETPLDATLREIEEESGINRNSLTYLREVGRLEYFKPQIHKKVRMYNFLFLANLELENSFEFIVNSDGKDNGLVFEYHWIEKSQIKEIDPELSQLINIYNLPEFFLNPLDWGLENSILRIRPHKKQWNIIYEFEEIEIRNKVPRDITIDHIGSTSVNSLYSKPIVDILIGITDKLNIDTLINGLKNIGYKYHKENGISGRYYFTKGNDKFTLFHIHAFELDSSEFINHLKVKRNLLENKNLLNRYQQYKQTSLDLTRLKYTENKVEIMNEIIQFDNNRITNA